MVRNVGRLKHLVFSAHGYISYDQLQGGCYNSRIDIGAGLDKYNIKLFRDLRDSVNGGVIWFGSCGIGNDNERNFERASLSGAYVVAPVQYMAPKPGSSRVIPYGKIDMFERYQPKVFAPTGELVAWASFVRMGKQLGLRPS